MLGGLSGGPLAVPGPMGAEYSSRQRAGRVGELSRIGAAKHSTCVDPPPQGEEGDSFGGPTKKRARKDKATVLRAHLGLACVDLSPFRSFLCCEYDL